VNDPFAFDFEQRVRENHRVVYQVAHSILKNAADADDVTQDAFVRAYEKATELRDPDRFRAWVCRIARNLALNRVRDERRRSARQARSAPVADDGRDVAGTVLDQDFEAHVRREIERLPDHLREVVLLCAIDGLAPSIVAHILGIPAGTVRSRLHLARKRLLGPLVP
jgi:RNA polymerase sigma-70 factor (ECF subfamily)